MTAPNEEYSVRLCHICKWPTFDGFGFNLHAEKNKVGQFIGKIDKGSPAEAAGLKEGDRIIEVNGVNISNENHKQVVQRIKSIADETRLLVVDPVGDAYFKSQNIVLKGNLPFVVYQKSPPKDPNLKAKDGSNNLISYANHQIDNSSQKMKNSYIIDDEKDGSHENKPKLNDEKDGSHENKPKLNLNMTAKELRAKLAAKKKNDPRKDQTINIKQKYEIVEKL